MNIQQECKFVAVTVGKSENMLVTAGKKLAAIIEYVLTPGNDGAQQVIDEGYEPTKAGIGQMCRGMPEWPKEIGSSASTMKRLLSYAADPDKQDADRAAGAQRERDVRADAKAFRDAPTHVSSIVTEPKDAPSLYDQFLDLNPAYRAAALVQILGGLDEDDRTDFLVTAFHNLDDDARLEFFRQTGTGKLGKHALRHQARTTADIEGADPVQYAPETFPVPADEPAIETPTDAPVVEDSAPAAPQEPADEPAIEPAPEATIAPLQGDLDAPLPAAAIADRIKAVAGNTPQRCVNTICTIDNGTWSPTSMPWAYYANADAATRAEITALLATA